MPVSQWVNDKSETRQRTPNENAVLAFYQDKWAEEREELRKARPEYVQLQDERRAQYAQYHMEEPNA